jgi:hypothetical protein
MLLGGSVYFQSAKIYEGSSYYDLDVTSTTLKIEPKIGFYLSSKFILGFKTGFTFLENAPYDYYATADPWHRDSGYETIAVHGKLINFAPFLRYQNKLNKILDYYVDVEIGAEFSIELQSATGDNSYSHDKYNFNAYSGALSSGLILNISNTLGVEVQIIGFDYCASFRKDSKKPLSTFNTDFIFSNPNIGLLFYF